MNFKDVIALINYLKSGISKSFNLFKRFLVFTLSALILVSLFSLPSYSYEQNLITPDPSLIDESEYREVRNRIDQLWEDPEVGLKAYKESQQGSTTGIFDPASSQTVTVYYDTDNPDYHHIFDIRDVRSDFNLESNLSLSSSSNLDPSNLNSISNSDNTNLETNSVTSLTNSPLNNLLQTTKSSFGTDPSFFTAFDAEIKSKTKTITNFPGGPSSVNGGGLGLNGSDGGDGISIDDASNNPSLITNPGTIFELPVTNQTEVLLDYWGELNSDIITRFSRSVNGSGDGLSGNSNENLGNNSNTSSSLPGSMAFPTTIGHDYSDTRLGEEITDPESMVEVVSSSTSGGGETVSNTEQTEQAEQAEQTEQTELKSIYKNQERKWVTLFAQNSYRTDRLLLNTSFDNYSGPNNIINQYHRLTINGPMTAFGYDSYGELGLKDGSNNGSGGNGSNYSNDSNNNQNNDNNDNNDNNQNNNFPIYELDESGNILNHQEYSGINQGNNQKTGAIKPGSGVLAVNQSRESNYSRNNHFYLGARDVLLQENDTSKEINVRY